LKIRLAGRHAANQILTAEITEVADEGLMAVAQSEVVDYAV
jgi:hypothetical protein